MGYYWIFLSVMRDCGTTDFSSAVFVFGHVLTVVTHFYTEMTWIVYFTQYFTFCTR